MAQSVFGTAFNVQKLGPTAVGTGEGLATVVLGGVRDQSIGAAKVTVAHVAHVASSAHGQGGQIPAANLTVPSSEQGTCTRSHNNEHCLAT
eukprot:m.322293 g.322293  ORF g.322293 m.322293 type:complete len:91 (+) comp55515_c0_seq4:276-548(+)